MGGQSVAFEFRTQDPRLGRFLSTDPLTAMTPWETPYAFAGNSPIANIDYLGLARKGGKQGSALEALPPVSAEPASSGPSISSGDIISFGRMAGSVQDAKDPPLSSNQGSPNVQDNSFDFGQQLNLKSSSSTPPGEFERDENGDWVRVTNIGDDIGLDFFHDDVIRDGEAIQETTIRDRNGNENVMRNGRRWLRGAVDRNPFITSDELYNEFAVGAGPNMSIFIGMHPANGLILESNWLNNELQEFTSSGEIRLSQGYVWDSGLRAMWNDDSRNWQLTFMGSYNVSFYRMGARTLVFIIDNKTFESQWVHFPGTASWNMTREEARQNGSSLWQTTTEQRYLFFIPFLSNRR
jgi:hypothetical protein